MGGFLRSIPAAASSPYAFAAYAIAAVLFLFAGARLRMAKLLLVRIEAVPKADRRRVLEIASGTVLPTHISPEQWIRLNRLRWAFLLLTALLIALITVATIAFLSPSRPEQGKGLIIVRTTIDRTKEDLPILDITLRNDGSKVAVLTNARIRVLDRWHIGPLWITPDALPASYQYDIGIPGTKGGSINVPISQELRPQTADRFKLALGPGEGEWYPAVGLFIHLLQVELQYNEDQTTLKLPLVFTHIPPPWTIVASVSGPRSAADLQAVLADANSAKRKIPLGGLVDATTVKALDEHIKAIEAALDEARNSHPK